ncbi:hypothetical protein PV433_13545 [Paenibacillus sp. GYB004]|uniref:hypothetical protein n=1 Tax=Paenibacillus sp. GYB004 TaxID=2994393 RepID=UPI002F9674A8
MLTKQRYSRLRRRALALAVFAIIAILAEACSLTGMPSDPGELLKQTVSGLSGTDDFRFEGTTSVSVGGLPMQEGASFEGVVNGHNRLSMSFNRGSPGAGTIGAAQAGGTPRSVVFSKSQNEWVVSEANSQSDAIVLLPWSPLYKLEQLNTMAKKTESARDEQDTRLTILTVTPETADVTKAVRDQLARQADVLDIDKQLAGLRTRHGLSEAEAARMRGELEQSVLLTKRQLDEAEGSLEAGAVYRIWVDRVSRLPRKMQIETEMKYTSDGQPKTETIRVDYLFTDYNNKKST